MGVEHCMLQGVGLLHACHEMLYVKGTKNHMQ